MSHVNKSSGKGMPLDLFTWLVEARLGDGLNSRKKEDTKQIPNARSNAIKSGNNILKMKMLNINHHNLLDHT
jgi:hypothetical protein